MIRSTAVRVMVTLDRALVAFVDDECFNRERERSWAVDQCLRRWKRRLESERRKRKERRCEN